MTKITTGAIAALLASTAMATAGGLDRSGQSIGIIFETGTHVELSYGYVSPAVSGQGPFDEDTGALAPSYSLFASGIKTDVTDDISVAVILDQPFGAGADYPVGEIDAFRGTTADLTSTATTVLVSYDVTDNIVVYGGAVAQSMSATALMPFKDFYSVDAEADTGFGYVLGAAYQIPEYAMRVALTYRSEISTSHDSAEANGNVLGLGGSANTVTDITTPQSLTLDFQSGVNEKTLVFGSVRWVEWSEFTIEPENFPGNPMVSYENDVITYSLGVGRKLTDNLSGAITVGYEESKGGTPSVLAPTDGYTSVGAGLTYSYDNVKITGGVKYLWLGDSAEVGVGSWSDNTAMAFGLKLAYSL